VNLLLATRNRNKVIEIQRALEGTGWQVLILSDIADAPDVEEDGSTFRENALKKARSAARFSKLWTLAEDSGLEIDALGGEPGVKSARYAGEGASDMDRIGKVIGLLTSAPDEGRSARFRCVMCVIDPVGNENCFEGRCEGRIAHTARGTAGFGYDPIFIPDGYDQTFAELGLAVKGRISHRARAMQHVLTFLRTHASSGGQ
jgi:XTP/dITP diphosphohydrolase